MSKRSKKKYKFEATPAIEETWNQFREALATALADLDEDEFLIIIAKPTGHFVQFSAQGASGMRAEAQSNNPSCYLSK